jgi:thiol:disulfide interchange protein DsbD
MRQALRWFCSFFLISSILVALSANVSAAFKGKPLDSNQAFGLTVQVEQKKIVTHWQLAPGYYLYQQTFQFRLLPDLKVTAEFPPHEWKVDQSQQKKAVFAGKFQIPLVVTGDLPSSAQLYIAYQGCSKRGFCYPPMAKEFTVNFAQQTVTEMTVAPTVAPIQYQNLMTNQNEVKSLLDSTQYGVMVLIFLGIGLLLAFTPCVLPMIPILTSIVVGQRQPVSMRRAFTLSVTYVLGSALTYAAAGVAAALLGSSLQVFLQQPWIIALAAFIFVLLAFSLFGFYELRLPNHWQNRLAHLSQQQRGGTYLGVFMMGVISALIVSPCVTAPLVGALMFISDSGNIWFGATALFALGIGMGIPLLLIGISAGRWLPKAGAWMEVVKMLFGAIMLAMAIWLLSRLVSAHVITFLSVLLLVVTAIYVWRHLPLLLGYPRIHRALAGLIAVVASMILVVDVIRPPFLQSIWPGQTERMASSFTIVRSVNELNEQLAAANAVSKPVILDFYADWCESCVVMDKKIFTSPSVRQKLNHYVLLRADLSNATPEIMLLLKKMSVIAPPAILFFDPYGNESHRERIVGEVTEAEFLQRLNLFAQANCGVKNQC